MITRQKYLTETVPTNTLEVGDFLIAYGGLFRVVRVWASACEPDVHANYCEFIENAVDGQECLIPHHWRDGRKPYGLWNQQGNGLARTCRVLAFVL